MDLDVKNEKIRFKVLLAIHYVYSGLYDKATRLINRSVKMDEVASPKERSLMMYIK